MTSTRKQLQHNLSLAKDKVRNSSNGNPAKAYAAEAAAKQALAAYDEAHPEEVAEIEAERQAAKAERAAETAQGYIARGLD